MREMGTEQEHQDGYHKQELLCWGVLIPVVDLFPHVQVVVGSGVEFERDSPHPVKHQEGGGHVGDVDERP